jgi:hypothetical protein|tara:strand:+ start:1325 stop:1465 length:141 start_codon:yes stop_codon:yes gene_type:complete
MLTETQDGAARVLAFSIPVGMVNAHLWVGSKTVQCRSYATLLGLSV